MFFAVKGQRALLAGTAVAGALFAAVPSLAQTTAPATEAPVAAEATAAEATATATPAAEPQGDVVIVTATRRETNLQKTPIAISVLSDKSMQDRHAQSLLDLADGAVPSLRVATFEARQSALTVGIRGIVPFDANQTLRDQGVGVYIDGVYLGRQQGLNAALMDIQRVEVLRGPQGTLFGRNTEGGALNIVTKGPSQDFNGRVSAGFGNYGSYTGQAHINLPVDSTLAVKLDGVIQHQDATTKNPLEGAFGWNYYNRYGGRAAARWTPTDKFTADIAYDYSRDENTPMYSQLLNYNPGKYPVATVAEIIANKGKVPAGKIAPLPNGVVVGTDRVKSADIAVPQQPSVDTSRGFSATLKYKVSPALELRSITAWRNVATYQWDNSGGAHRTPFAPGGNFSRYSLSDMTQRQFSQEIQAVGSLPSLDYALGGYYFNEAAQEAAATPFSNQWQLRPGQNPNDINSYVPVIVDPTAAPGSARSARKIDRATHGYTKSYAAFGQATWTPAGFDQFHLTVGARYTNDQRHGDLYIVSGSPVLSTAIDPKTGKYIPLPIKVEIDSERVDPLVILALDAADGVNVYAKYSTGYRAGGANTRSPSFLVFGPESVKAYEVGAKLDLFDRKVRLNLAGYAMDRKDTQIDFDDVIVNPNTNSSRHDENTRNAKGISKIRGIEAELTVRPATGLQLGASYAYTDAKVPPALNNSGTLQRVFVVFTPEHAATGFIDFEQPALANGAKVRFHLDANYASSQYSFQDEALKTDPSFIMNGSIALADFPVNQAGSTFTVSLWGRNLLNETHIYRRSGSNGLKPGSTSFNVLGDYGNLNPPRTLGVEGSLKF